ncbi:molybdenum cofactor guanylyltransferase [Aquibacillus kalidii]|uniref:molybdenum cofactor guanylyltransferase n=1 Tax=Aquibacillus kalidii TaxID=2762597 RepID=UPI0016456BF6|nr:molybdenum cofactor guanylyltransferase [Aquibacillus kalidii]
MTYTIVGVLIAGGESRRFGSPKAFATRKGLPFYHYSKQALEVVSDEVIIVTSNLLKNSFERDQDSAHIICDCSEFSGDGPLAGIYTAMQEVQSEWYMVLPIDIPFIDSLVMKEIVANRHGLCEAVIPLVNGRTQPLIALYHYSVKEKIEKQLVENKKSLKQLLEHLKVNYIEIEDEKSFVNINTKDDFGKYVD